MRGLFVTATDTGVGKTILSAALLAAMVADGESVRAHKPAVTGLEDAAEIAARGAWPPDHELLGAAAGMPASEVTPLCFGVAASPHYAAQLAGVTIEPAQLLANARAHDGEHTLIVEGVGGLLTPLAKDYCVCDLAAALRLPLVIAARPGLGTINHTLLTVRAARCAGLDVRAVVLTPWPAHPTGLELSNEAAIAQLARVPVERLPLVPAPSLSELARAGRALTPLLMGKK